MSLKKFFPKSIWTRFLLILCAPVFFMQIIAGYIYWERHTTTVLRTTSTQIAGNVALIRLWLKNKKSLSEVQKLAENYLHLSVNTHSNKKFDIIPPYNVIEKLINDALADAIKTPILLSFEEDYLIFTFPDIHINGKNVYVKVQMKRLLSRTTLLVLFVTLLSGLLFLFIAILFLRVQLRPLVRLSQAADDFGKGEDVPDLPLAGATEVRKASHAFNMMKERLKRDIQEKTEMLAGVSHDLRTPLTRMKLLLALPDTNLETLKTLKEEVNLMTDLVEGFLSFSRGLVQEPKERVHIKSYFESCLAPYSSVHLSCPEDFYAEIKKISINRLLTNLVVNSLKYGSHVWIDVTYDNECWTCIVDDDGIGIPEDQREAVFRPFYRIDLSRNTETGGVGLGLTIVRDVIHNHGGQVMLQESPFKGLRVYICLPL